MQIAPWINISVSIGDFLDNSAISVSDNSRESIALFAPSFFNVFNVYELHTFSWTLICASRPCAVVFSIKPISESINPSISDEDIFSKLSLSSLANFSFKIIFVHK